MPISFSKILLQKSLKKKQMMYALAISALLLFSAIALVTWTFYMDFKIRKQQKMTVNRTGKLCIAEEEDKKIDNYRFIVRIIKTAYLPVHFITLSKMIADYQKLYGYDELCSELIGEYEEALAKKEYK